MSLSMLAIAIAVGAALAVLALYFALLAYRSSRTTNQRREQVLKFAGHDIARERADHRRKHSRTLSAIDRILDSIKLRERMSLSLDRAGIPVSPAQWSLLSVVSFVVLGLVLGLVTGSFWLGVASSAVIAIIVPRLIIGRREAKRKQAFEEDLPEFFLMMASALRSGLSFSQALEAVARDGTSEVDRQMRRAVTEVSMGVTPDQALGAVADRMDSEDMRWAVVALSIQKEVGGNLSTILDSVAETVRSRADVTREVRSLSAEGRLSAVVLVIMPVVIFAILAVLRPDYVEIFWGTALGRVMLIGTIALFISGSFWMRAVVRVRA